jgi:guanine deaminase
VNRSYRAALLRFDADHQPVYDADGLLVVGPDEHGRQVVQAAGAFATLTGRYGGLPVEDLRGKLIAPGFVDMHVHYPQTDVIGAPADGLLPWLEDYTFPHEARFCDPAYARGVADFFFDELQRNGVTTALTFATSHPVSVHAAFEAAQERGHRKADPALAWCGPARLRDHAALCAHQFTGPTAWSG